MASQGEMSSLKDGKQDSCNLPRGWDMPEGQEKQPVLKEEKQELNIQQEQTNSQG